MSAEVSSTERQSFYEAAVLGLHALGERGNGRQRLDADAWARWAQFKGDLTDGDFLDLLIRDAAVEQPAGFAPQVVFRLAGLADDDPFGATWPGANPALAARILRERPADVDRTLSVLAAVAQAWSLTAGRVRGDLAGLTPATRILVAGTGAILAVAEAWLGADGRPRAGFDWADQVTVVTDRPGDRQLAGLAGALVGASRPVVVRSVKDAERVPADRLVTSDDATAAVLQAVAYTGSLATA